MDQEKSSNSSFEDLSNLNEAEIRAPDEEPVEKSTEKVPSNVDDILDIIGNGQLTKKIITKPTTDIQPQQGDLVKITYTGKLDDGTVVEEKTEVSIHVGDFEVVQGLDLTLPLMKVGEVAEVSVDSRFAYGALGLNSVDGAKQIIPPDARITYTLHLHDCKTEEFEDLKSYKIRKEYGNRKRERANFWYKRNEFNTAIQIYRKALEFLDDRDSDPEASEDIEMSNSELQSLLDDRLVVYNNLAMAQIKISAYDAALMSVENVLRCQPNNSKALYRKGKILDAKGDTKGAIALFQKAATLEPDSRTIQQDLAKLIIKARREEHNEKEMYQKMLGQAKKLEQRSQTKQKPQNTAEVPKLRLLGYLMGSILIGVAGVAMYRYKY